MTAKDDKVWAIWLVVGHHTADCYGLPATGRAVDVIEAGMWRVEDGLIADARFFGDELALLQQLDLFEASRTPGSSDRLWGEPAAEDTIRQSPDRGASLPRTVDRHSHAPMPVACQPEERGAEAHEKLPFGTATRLFACERCGGVTREEVEWSS